MGYDLNFFKTSDGVIFQRCARTYYNNNWENARFIGYFMSSKRILIKVIAIVGDEKISFRPDSSSKVADGPAFEIK